MDLQKAKAHFESGLYPESGEYGRWMIAEIERLRANRSLKPEEAWRVEDCQKNLDQYRTGAKWYPNTLQQSEFLLELVERLTKPLTPMCFKCMPKD